MLNLPFNLLKLLPPEIAHELTIFLLKIKPSSKSLKIIDDRRLHQNIWNLNFNNPIGLAAGFDKNAEIIQKIFDFGFGFVETGTITPFSQFGNPRPRVFRLLKDQAIINQLGFNNKGLENALKEFKKINLTNFNKGIIGANIGKNKNSLSSIEDFCLGYEKLGPLAHYVTINISSPNTPGLRDLQTEENIDKIFTSLNKIKERNSNLLSKPIFLKISPDLNDLQIKNIAQTSLSLGIDGVIISNTTTERILNLKSRNIVYSGGLSGKPLFSKSTNLLKKFFNLTEGKIPLIGVGGVSSGYDCYKKIKSGASLVQIYTSLIYQGPNIVNNIKVELLKLLKSDGFENINQAIGIEA